MQAYISALNFVDKIGTLSAEGSQESWTFSTKALSDPEDFDGLCVGVKADFALIDGKVRSLVPEKFTDPDADRSYSLPDEVSFETGHLRQGFEILDVGRYRLSRTTRDLNKSRAELASLCRLLGGNTLLEVSESQEQKTAMGYAFIYYTVKGFVASAGRPAEAGAVNASDLLQSINHNEIKRRGLRHENAAAGKIALRIAGGVLLAVFCLGYLFTTFF